MNVKELIELTNQLSLDAASPTEKSQQRYLRYLNLANMELYTIAAGGLKTLLKKVELFLDDSTQNFKLPDDLYKIRLLSINRQPLLSDNIDNIEYIGSDKYLVVGDRIHTNLTAAVSNYLLKEDPTDRVLKKYITLLYVPNPKKLVVDVTNPLLETNTPVYPVPYHHFLAHGALYYYYFSNKVFMEKMAHIKDKWKEDKDEIATFKNYGL